MHRPASPYPGTTVTTAAPAPGPVLLRRRAALGLLAGGLALATMRSARAAAKVVKAEVAPALYELAFSPARNALYVLSAGGFEEGSPASHLFCLDPDSLAIRSELVLPLRGFGLALDDAGGRLYVGHTLDAAVSAVDLGANRIAGTLRLASKVKGEDGKEDYPYKLRELLLDPSGERLYLPGLGLKDSQVYVVGTKGLTAEKPITGIGPGATGISLDPAKDRLFISTLAGQLFTIDRKTQEVRHSVEAGGAEQPLNLAYDPASGAVLAVDQGMESLTRYKEKMIPGFKSKNPGNRVVAVEPESGKLLWEAAVGEGPVALRLDAARQRLFVTNRGSGSVSVLDTGRHSVTETVPLPPHPNSLALDEKSGAAFVSIKLPFKQIKEKDSVARITL
ncbi:YncE family protein [Roseomonas gilardii subsp. gilardii]|uniref:YncE family protein n=1 Tax=Roseomonas gilardii TaxID=257708 RepID=UPI001FF85F04|nr:YncE family protein [Roseomonas gilardii]UPG73608.1 YncE family protein [Roseomonas gilardii subsp. gilardii]